VAPAGTKLHCRQFSTGRSHGPVLNCLFYITGGTWRSSPSPPSTRETEPPPPVAVAATAVRPPAWRMRSSAPHCTARVGPAPPPPEPSRARLRRPSSPPMPASSALRCHPCLRRPCHLRRRAASSACASLRPASSPPPHRTGAAASRLPDVRPQADVSTTMC